MPANTSVTETEERSTDKRQAAEDSSLRWGAYLISAAGAMFVVHAVGFLYRTYYNPGFELGVGELDGVTATELAVTHPEVASYVEHLHVSFAGLMIAVGIGIIALAWYGAVEGGLLRHRSSSRSYSCLSRCRSTKPSTSTSTLCYI